VLSLATPLTGKLNVTGLAVVEGDRRGRDALAGVLGGNIAKQIAQREHQVAHASAEIKGNVTFTSRRSCRRLASGAEFGRPVTLGDSSLVVAGARVNVPAQVKPSSTRTSPTRSARVETRLRNDRSFEQGARVQWAKACRSIPLQGVSAGSTLPQLWLGDESRPAPSRHSPASMPRRVTVTLGIEAETRHHPAQTKPDWPVPARSNHSATPGGVSNRGADDVPFTEINKIVEAQFAGRTFPRTAPARLPLP